MMASLGLGGDLRRQTGVVLSDRDEMRAVWILPWDYSSRSAMCAIY